MKKLLVFSVLLVIGFAGRSQSIEAFLEACVLDDTLFIDVMVQNNTGSSFFLGGSNFVFDIVDPVTDAPVTTLDWTAKTRVDTAEGPWDDSGNGDYDDMTLNPSQFINLTIVADEADNLGAGPNTGTSIPSTATRVARIALPVLTCGDTVSLRWRYRGRDPAFGGPGGHSWFGSNMNFGTGTYTEWGASTVDRTGTFSFADLENVLLCNNICSSQPLSITQQPDSVCYNDLVTFKVPGITAGDSVYWYVNGVLTQSSTLDSFQYNVTSNDSVWASVTNGSCSNCPSVTSTVAGITLLSSDTMNVNAGLDTTINEGELVTLNGAASGTSGIYWTPGIYLSDSTILNPVATLSDTTMMILHGYGAIPRCEVTDTVIINVIENVLEVTNLFTPNGDGVNDTWTVNDLDEVANCKVQIYSRWGIKVFEAEPYLNDWDGTENGKPLPGGAYYYVFTCSDREGPVLGHITLIR